MKGRLHPAIEKNIYIFEVDDDAVVNVDTAELRIERFVEKHYLPLIPNEYCIEEHVQYT